MSVSKLQLSNGRIQGHGQDSVTIRLRGGDEYKIVLGATKADEDRARRSGTPVQSSNTIAKVDAPQTRQCLSGEQAGGVAEALRDEASRDTFRSALTESQWVDLWFGEAKRPSQKEKSAEKKERKHDAPLLALADRFDAERG